MADTHEIKQTLWEKMADSPFLMVGLTGTHQHSEPLTAQLDKDLVDTLFFACLSGTISQTNDRAAIDKLWNKQVEAWFPGGKDDPNLALIRLDIDSAELWETDMSLSGRLKMLFGGTIRSGESGSHAKVETTAA